MVNHLGLVLIILICILLDRIIINFLEKLIKVENMVARVVIEILVAILSGYASFIIVLAIGFWLSALYS